jgi:hypothetical protein
MAKLTRQLYELVRGVGKENKDQWRLVFDTEGKRLYVEHEWSHADMWRVARSNSGSAEFDINGFLAEGEAPAQAELMRMIKSLLKMGTARMPKGPRGQKRPADVIGDAVPVVKTATGEIKEPKKAPKEGRKSPDRRAKGPHRTPAKKP